MTPPGHPKGDRDLARKTIFMSDKLKQLFVLRNRLTAISAQTDLMNELYDLIKGDDEISEYLMQWIRTKNSFLIVERQNIQAQLVAYDAQNPTE